MADLNTSQKELIEHRQDIYRRWHRRNSKPESIGVMLASAYVDHRAHRTIQRMIRDAKVLLYDNGRLLLNSTVWGYIRDAMRVPPRVFYERHDSTWATAYPRTGTVPTTWARTTFSGEDVTANVVPVATVPVAAAAVNDVDALKFLGYVGGRIISQSEIPSGNRLILPDITIQVTQGNIALGRLAASLGVPPYVYSELPDDQPNFATVNENGVVTLNAPNDAVVGSHSVLVKVTDATGLTAIATVTVEVIARGN